MSVNSITMHTNEPILKFSGEINPSVYETETYFTARLDIEGVIAVGDTPENAVRNLMEFFKVFVIQMYQINKLESLLMKYGWKAEIHSKDNIVYIQPPMKFTLIKGEYNLSSDELEIVNSISSVEELKDMFVKDFGINEKELTNVQ